MIMNHINDTIQYFLKFHQLLPDKFSSRIPRNRKLHNFSGIVIEYKINIEPLIKCFCHLSTVSGLTIEIVSLILPILFRIEKMIRSQW